jgi:hypothetical protein
MTERCIKFQMVDSGFDRLSCCTLVPHRFALYTRLGNFVRAPLRSPSINRSNDRRRGSERISRLGTTKKPTPAMLPTTTRSSYHQYPLLTPFPAHPMSPCDCISLITHRGRPPSPDSIHVPTVIYSNTMVFTPKFPFGDPTHRIAAPPRP